MSALDYRNPRMTETGTIDMEIDHPVFGWIPFTASPADPEEYGRNLHAEALLTAAPYVPAPVEGT